MGLVINLINLTWSPMEFVINLINLTKSYEEYSYFV